MFPVIFLLVSTCICVYSARNLRKDNTKEALVDPKKVSTELQIYDIIHSRIPYIPDSRWSDVMITLQLLLTVLNINLIDFYEICIVMGINQLLRVLCFTSTILPPLQKYETKIRFLGLNGSGTEYIYSGHASYSAISFIYLLRSGIDFYPLLFYNMCSQMLIILSRNHYTVDVILAWIIVPLLWGNLKWI